MKTIEIAKQLAQLCREGKNAEAVDLLFAADVVSVEPGGPPGMDREAKGIAALKAKSEWWRANHEIHSATIIGPWPHDDKFVIGFKYDVTNKPSGTRMTMDEVGLYYVRDGKIVREEFFYEMG